MADGDDKEGGVAVLDRPAKTPEEVVNEIQAGWDDPADKRSEGQRQIEALWTGDIVDPTQTPKQAEEAKQDEEIIVHSTPTVNTRRDFSLTNNILQEKVDADKS